MRRLTHIIVLGAFVFSCGGQWYVLQAVAWVKMLHDYAQVVPLAEAAKMTFSGQYPCEICKAIEEKKQSENDKPCSLEKQEKKFFSAVEIKITTPATVPFAYADDLNSLQGRSETPPTPPPRLALN